MKNITKKIFIPGWMDTADNHVDYPGLEIWKKKIDPNASINAEYIIGHSLGANFALINWKHNKNTKLVLINPLIFKRNILSWFGRWIKFLLSEGLSFDKKRFSTLPHFTRNIAQCYFLLSRDLMDIFDDIPVEKITVIGGKEDKYFFDAQTSKILKTKGVKIIEIEGAGHKWSKKFDAEVDKIVK